MRRSTKRGRYLAGALALAMVLTACGGSDDDPTGDEPSGDETPTDAEDDGTDGDEDPDADGDEPAAGGGDIIFGTTDTVVSLDPAKAYDYASSNILFNVGETLIAFPAGSTEPEPHLAEEIEVSDDGLEYTFHIREGVTFHNGKELTAEDVKFSLDRVTSMQHPAGAWSMLAGIESVEVTDEMTAVVTLSEPNSTFLPRLGYTVAMIVPSDGHYPAPDTAIAEEDAEELEQAAEEFVQEDVVGTGPYRLSEFNVGESITLEANPDYWGDAPLNDRIMVRFFQTSSQMKIALESGEIDVAHRDFSPDEQADLETNDQIQSIVGDGGRTRFIVLNPTHDVVADADVRKGIAAAIDRDRIAADVFNDAVEPLYSMIPPGFPQSNPEYFQTLSEQDPSDYIDETISFSLHYGGERYGPTEPSLVQAIQRQLEETGLFEVDLVSTEWAQFTEEAWPGEDGQYPVFMLGWNPDFVDPDTYIEQFLWSQGAWGSMLNDPEFDDLVLGQQAELDPDARDAMLDEIQERAAEAVVNIPLFQEPQVAFAQPDITGLQETLDEAMIMRYWMISRS